MALDPGLVGLQMKEAIPAEFFALCKSGVSPISGIFFGLQAFLRWQNIIKHRKYEI